MKYLFYFYSCFNSTMFGGLVDEAIELAKNSENNVLFAYCGGINQSCRVVNDKASKSMCTFCSRCTEKVLKQYGIKCVSLHIYAAESKVKFDYCDAKVLRNIKYRDVCIGMSIMSGYISSTRNQSPLIDKKARVYFDKHLDQNVKFVDALYGLIDEFVPDVIYSFNGRFEEVRPLFDISKSRGITCYMTEVIKKSGVCYKVSFKDHLPHDIKYNLERRHFCWSNYEMSEAEKYELGNSFYKKRRNGEESGDVKIYVANQKEGNISGFDNNKINIAIFNSSEDEFAAIGGDWDVLKIFPNQFEGIKYLVENAPNNVHFILRIHPNLKEIPYKFHRDLYDLPKKYNNITVIPADSNASTYTIMENCDKIICFGSTMGVESSYWGKPSILLGPSWYYYDDVVYVPKSKEEALALLTKELKPKNNMELLKFGAYILNKEPLIVEVKSINCDLNKRSFFGYEYFSTPFINFFFSEKITGLYIAINRFLRYKRGSLRMPIKEEL